MAVVKEPNRLYQAKTCVALIRDNLRQGGCSIDRKGPLRIRWTDDTIVAANEKNDEFRVKRKGPGKDHQDRSDDEHPASANPISIRGDPQGDSVSPIRMSVRKGISVS